ncbi:QacE family quaternary ammonium compound efflux SMR transporter [Deinococcus aerophilus]|uniref:QacE family quaternary ammonium compound efflux SMR transporter n=1 Tax=Deinococcus aerophilus TaxID=522488 RepID=A0ABQ2GM84_9DEIO|nr:QacE family quaternary ammonium compound efflux SMR transporter [Deinococcus aerophilus]
MKGWTGWHWLVLAGLLEIGFATALKLEQTRPVFFYVFLGCAYLSFDFLSRALRTIPLGTAYAIWTGIGAVGAVFMGTALFGESLSPARLVLIGLLIAALTGLKWAGGARTAQKTAPPGKGEAAGGAGEL